MKISSIEIRDTYGTEYARFAPGTVTRLKGANGKGKSSILKALVYVFEGGSDPQVIRKGAEASQITIGLDDGTVITKTTRPKRARGKGDITGYTTELEVLQPDGTPRQAPQSYIRELSEHLAVDPSVLLRIDASTTPGRKQLATELMKLVPLDFTREEVSAAIAKRPGALNPDPAAYEAPAASLNLDGLKKFAADITETRRRLGVTRDDAWGATKRLEQSLPAANGADHGATLANIERERKDIEDAITARKLDIQKQANDALTGARAAMNAAIDAAKEQFRKTEHAIAKVVEDETTALEAEAKPEQDRITAAIATETERRNSYLRAAGMREEIERQREVSRQAAIKYDRLSEVLANLEALRLEKLQNLPVPGLVVEDGAAYLDGIAWNNVNLARRVEACLQICTQRAGRLPLLIVDDSEHLDSETRAAIEEGLTGAGWQLIEAIVSDGPLTIEIVNQEVAA